MVHTERWCSLQVKVSKPLARCLVSYTAHGNARHLLLWTKPSYVTSCSAACITATPIYAGGGSFVETPFVLQHGVTGAPKQFCVVSMQEPD